MPSDVKEQPGPEPRPTSFRRLGDPNATQDVESRGGAATQPVTDTKADGGPEADEEAEPIEHRMSVLTFLKIVSRGRTTNYRQYVATAVVETTRRAPKTTRLRSEKNVCAVCFFRIDCMRCVNMIGIHLWCIYF